MSLNISELPATAFGELSLCHFVCFNTLVLKQTKWHKLNSSHQGQRLRWSCVVLRYMLQWCCIFCDGCSCCLPLAEWPSPNRQRAVDADGCIAGCRPTSADVVLAAVRLDGTSCDLPACRRACLPAVLQSWTRSGRRSEWRRVSCRRTQNATALLAGFQLTPQFPLPRRAPRDKVA